MTAATSALAALVAAASVTQLHQFGGKVFWNQDISEGRVGAHVEAPLASAGEGLRFCLAKEAEPTCPPIVCPCVVHSEGYFGDPWEPLKQLWRALSTRENPRALLSAGLHATMDVYSWVPAETPCTRSSLL